MPTVCVLKNDGFLKNTFHIMEDSIVNAIGKSRDDSKDHPRIPFLIRRWLEDQVNATETNGCKTDMNFTDRFLF